VRTQQAIWWTAFLAASASCHIYSRDQEPAPGGYEAGVYDPAPGRQVLDSGLVGGGGTGGAGGTGATGGTGGTGGSVGARDAGPAPRDQAVAADGSATPDLVMREDGNRFCDLLFPTCPAGTGCYPGAAGQGRCLRPDPGTSEGSQCFEATNCAPGLTCAASSCTPYCDPDNATCDSGKRCVALPAYPGVGYCLP
jgi:hypothetical protein